MIEYYWIQDYYLDFEPVDFALIAIDTESKKWACEIVRLDMFDDNDARQYYHQKITNKLNNNILGLPNLFDEFEGLYDPPYKIIDGEEWFFDWQIYPNADDRKCIKMSDAIMNFVNKRIN